MVHFSNHEIVAMVIGASFAAGLNVYATIATLGLVGHYGLFQLPPNLHVLQDWWVIGAALALFLLEFFADKIPAFDLIWNALHTFIRVPIAALLGYQATAQLSPQSQLLTAAMAGGIAFAAHGGKTAIRAAVTPSPEPLSNIGLSFGEDALAIALTWFATTHPYWAATATAILLVLVILLIRFIVRALRSLFNGAARTIEGLEHPG
jgi:uncharacterized protein DUF4126